MSRRIANSHKIVKGAFKKTGSKQHVHTHSSLGRTYFAYPPEGGWPGGDPVKNGLRAGGGKR